MIDLNSSSQLSDRINGFVDKALVEKNKNEKPRNYLGGSRLGVECERSLQYEYFNTTKGFDKNFTGKTLRIFQRGFWIEDAISEWIQNAGFDLKTESKDGKQFGFELLDGKVKGHCDGVLIAGPDDYKYPALWENKGTGAKAFNLVRKEGLKKAKPEYYAQIQMYQKHFQLTENPAFFSIVNMDSMEIHWELIEHDSAFADMLDAKAVRIIQACDAEELLPKQFNDSSYYICKWCSWQARCHELLPF